MNELKPSVRVNQPTGLQKLCWYIGMPLLSPICGSIYVMSQHKKITAVIMILLIALALCAKYVKTTPMDHFRNGLSVSYHTMADFLKDHVRAGLVGGLAGAIYLYVGREIYLHFFLPELMKRTHKNWEEYFLKNYDVYKVTKFTEGEQTILQFQGIMGTLATTQLKQFSHTVLPPSEH